MTGSREGDLELSLSESIAKGQTATRMLCDTMARLETAGRLKLASKDAREWWESHKKQDAKK